MNKIKICHFTSAHSATDGRIFEKECTSLAKVGYDVYLVATNAKEGVKNGVKIINVPTKDQGRLKRFICTTKDVYKKALSIDADVYHFHDPELLPYGLKLKRKGKKVIYDAHEDIEGQIEEKEYIPKIFRRIIAFSVQQFLNYGLKRFDGIITVSPHIVRKFQKVRKDVTMVTNFAMFDSSPVKHDANSRTICFPGAICRDWNHEVIIESLSKIKDSKYLLAGVSTDIYLDKLKAMSNWNKVEFLGKISFKDVKNMYERTAVGMAILSYSPNVGGKEGTLGNTKLFEYMLNEIPIVCTDFTLWGQIVREENCGIAVEPNDTNAISNAVNYLFDNPEIAIEMGKNGRRAVEEKYNWRIQEANLFELYERISGK